MAYDFSSFDTRATEIVSWLNKEMATIRTGRANPSLLDSVQVSSYGAKVPLNQVGTVGVEDPRTLRVNIWDAANIKPAENAIMDASLGLSVVADEQGLRVMFPELTAERRQELVKIAKGKWEESRVSIRAARDEAIKKIEAEELPKDDAFRAEEELQKRVDAKNKELEEIFEAKEKEIGG